MNRKGLRRDHIVTGRLFGSLNLERLQGMGFATSRQATDEKIHWLRFCTRQRLYSLLGSLRQTPFEKSELAQKERLVSLIYGYDRPISGGHG